MMRLLALSLSHAACLAAGFALGIYMLPILTAPDNPSSGQVESAAVTSRYTGEFRRSLEDSDALHWGEGRIFVGDDSISLLGRIAPGPDYRLYLTPRFVETEADFLALKQGALEVGAVKTFENFIVPVPDSVDVSAFSAVVIWCESFSQFITAAEYRPQR